VAGTGVAVPPQAASTIDAMTIIAKTLNHRVFMTFLHYLVQVSCAFKLAQSPCACNLELYGVAWPLTSFQPVPRTEEWVPAPGARV
jgi:hypothetical protein